jgi:hypothetical protein
VGYWYADAGAGAPGYRVPIYEYAAAFGVELDVIVGYEEAAGTGVPEY